MSTPHSEHCITEAAKLVNIDAGAAERLLAMHCPRPDGRCGGCGRSLTRWPCILVTIARRAQELKAARGR